MLRTAEVDPSLLANETPRESNAALFKLLLWLSMPVLAEHVLHIGVGLNDTWLAGHLVGETGLTGAPLEQARATNAAATAAVGTMTYILWFLGLIVGAIGTGSTALIARAKGARHRRIANSVCAQSVLAAIVLGIGLSVFTYFGASMIAKLAGLPPDAQAMAESYIRILSWSMPFTMVMFIANACLRGAGDTLTPAIAMIVVDVVNVFFSIGLTYGKFGLPAMGFDGIAVGTMIAYVAAGVLQFVVLLRGRGGVRLYLHRLKLHYTTLVRVLKIGVPSGMEGSLQWIANFGILKVVNGLGSNAAAAHNITIRVESLSYLTGYAVATAAATMVGQSLGMKDPARAKRCGIIAYAFSAGIMGTFGIAFIFFGKQLAGVLIEDPAIVKMSADCLFVAGFVQLSFAAALTFSGALRGAGDTLRVMVTNVASVILLRLSAVLIASFLGFGLTAIWIVLCAELCVRGPLMAARFYSGKWQTLKV